MKTIYNLTFLTFLTFLWLSCDNANASQAGFMDNSGNEGEKKEKSTILEAYKVGDKVDDFSLKNVDGKMVSMADYANAKGYIIIFTCNTCPYSNMYEDRIIALDKKYAQKGWPVIAINPNDPEIQEGDSFDNMKKRAGEKGYTFPYLLDEGQEVYPKWGAARTPHVFIVSNNNGGKILEYIGTIDDNARDESAVTVNYVDKTIASLEANETPEPRTTKAIGCTIKTK